MGKSSSPRHLVGKIGPGRHFLPGCDGSIERSGGGRKRVLDRRQQVFFVRVHPHGTPPCDRRYVSARALCERGVSKRRKHYCHA